MKIKLLFLLFFLLNITISAFSQDVQSELRKRLKVKNDTTVFTIKETKYYKFSENQVDEYKLILIKNGGKPNKTVKILLYNATNGHSILKDSDYIYFVNMNLDSMVKFSFKEKNNGYYAFMSNYYDHYYLFDSKLFLFMKQVSNFKKISSANSPITKFTFDGLDINSSISAVKIDFILNKYEFSFDTLLQNSFHVQYEIDTALVAGDDVYKTKIDYFIEPKVDNLKMINTLNSAVENSTLADSLWISDIYGFFFEKKNELHDLPIHENTITLYGFNNDSIDLQNSNTKFTVLDFWFIQCPPCLHGIPEVNTFAMDYASKSVRVLGVNCIDKNKASIMDVCQKHAMQYPCFTSSKKLQKYFNISMFPSYVLIDNRDNSVNNFLVFSNLNDLKIELEKRLEQ